jgi:autotransporter translocation and assembly factor TamB
LRRFLNRRVLIIAVVILLLIPISAIVGLYLFVNSPAFNERIHTFVVDEIAAYTGAQVSLESLRWSLKEQRIVLENLTLRTTPAEPEPPLLRIESITAGVNLRTLLRRRVDLSDLTIVNPEFNLRVDSEGKTNIPGPSPESALTPETEFRVSIDSFKITGGKGAINNRQFKFDVGIANLDSDLRYNSETRVLSAQLAYEGNLKRPGQRTIPYKMSSEFDFTQGTVVAHKIGITSGRSSVNLQGKIDHVLAPEIGGKLDYSGRFDSTFVRQFLPKDLIPGPSTARGILEFSPKNFTTKGDLTTDRVEFAGWKASSVKTAYTYDNSTKQLKLTELSAGALDGTATGNVVVDSLLSQPRFTVDLEYSNIDTAQLSTAYPWDPKYIVYSRADGSLQGWFEGRLEQFEFETTSTLTSYSPAPEPGVIALPVRGALTAALKPGLAEVKSGDLRLFDTRVQAEGQITGQQDADLTVKLESSDLANLFFLYPEANGKGSFTGTLKGNLQKPTLEGKAVLDNHKYREWVIRHAEGGVKLDMPAEIADLRNVALTVGDTTATINGAIRLDGSSVNLAIKSDHVRAEDFQSITNEKIGGILSGNATLTSLKPLKVAGTVRASGLTVRGHTFETVDGNLTYDEPSIEIRNLRTSEGNARLVASIVRYNPSTGALNAEGDITSLDLSQMRELGAPQTLGGMIRKAHLTVTGNRDRPQIAGNADIENLSFRGETFPRAHLDLKTDWPKLNVNVTETKNLSLQARVDLETAGYPIEASAKFTDYSLEKLARFSQGSLVATGNVNFEGKLAGEAAFSGTGVINSIDARIRDVEFHNAKPFEFTFDSKSITIGKGASFSGAYGTLVNMKGSIGLESSPPLDLEVTGDFDLAELATASENVDLSVTGTISLLGRVRGTTTNPTINGTATISKASLGREGIYTTVSNLNGDLRFSENRVTFDNLLGQVGGGDARIRGDGLIQNGQVENLSVRIDASKVNLRYPRGLSSSVTGPLTLTGTSGAPVLSGRLTLDRLRYDREFETILGFFRTSGPRNGGSALDRLRLAIHVEGNRNIVVQNELSDISAARVSLDIGGTWANPTLTGRIEITEGALLVQGKRYEITRGNVLFVDRLKIDPVLDIQAETDVRDYRVILAVFGKSSDRIRFEPRSYPPLPEVEVLSLIAGGRTVEELERSRAESVAGPGTASLPTSEELFPSTAASIFTDILRTKLGSRLGLSGLDWFQVSPQFERASSNPSLRVTLSQQVSKNLAVTYSQDLASSQQRLIMVEYFVSRNLSIVASREETNETAALGLDIKLRKRF